MFERIIIITIILGVFGNLATFYLDAMGLLK